MPKNHNFKVISNMSECYFKYRTKQVNKYVHRNLIEHPKKFFCIDNMLYWTDLQLICKKHFQANGIRLFTNTSYTIKSINNKQFTIFRDDQTFTFPIKILGHFQLPYANTCHSVQGTSIEGPMTIFDINSAYVDKYFVWTALTRATDFKNVLIFQHSDTEVSDSVRHKIRQYFELKVDGYKRQDKIAGRAFDVADYVTAEWISEEYDKLENETCLSCNTPYETVANNGEVHSNLTVDRIDNSKAHIKTNSRLCCVSCNRSRSNHY